MPLYRAQVTAWADSTLARDGVQITPHFFDWGATSDPENLAEDLADAMATYYGVARQLSVKIYNAQAPKPNEPLHEAIRGLGLSPASPSPRETAVCLSYYAGSNAPRKRGRFYLPIGCMFSGLGVRPSGAIRDKAGALAPILEQLGGVDVDWVVYSRVDNTSRAVTNWWVDDEWDTVRSRGLRGTARTEGTTSEDTLYRVAKWDGEDWQAVQEKRSLRRRLAAAAQMAGAYSERLLAVVLHGVVKTVTVPSDKRAIVKQVCAVNDAAGSGVAAGYINGTSIWRASLPGNTAAQSVTLFAVAYGGETLGGYISVSGMYLYLFGYLFDDTGGGRLELETEREPQLEPAPLPQM